MEEVIIDFGPKPWIQFGLFYTSISRVKSGDSLFIKNFNPDYIQANPKVEERLTTMKTLYPYKFKKVRLDDKIFISDDELKLGYINIRSLLEGRSMEFLNNDQNLRCLNYLVVADTRLDDKTSSDYLAEHLSNWRILKRDDAKDGRCHMGLLVLQEKTSTTNINLEIVDWLRITSDKTVYAQYILVHFSEILLHTAFVYIRTTPTHGMIDQMINYFKKPRAEGPVNLIMGDLNLDYTRDTSKLDKLCGEDKCRILNETTTVNLNQLDHVIIEKSRAKNDTFSTSYYNYTSDHHAIVVRIPDLDKGNTFSSEFKISVNFDESNETRIGLKRKAETDHQSPRKILKSEPQLKRKAEGTDDNENPRKSQRIESVHVTLPVISVEMDDVIREALNSSSGTEVVTRRARIHVLISDIKTLIGSNWLIDTIVHSMFALIADRSNSTFTFDTHFRMTLEMRGRINVNSDIFEYKTIIIPVHTENPGHWSTVGIDVEKKKIFYFNSLKRRNDKSEEDFLELVFNFLNQEHLAKKGIALDSDSWKRCRPQKIPIQRNGHDCGVFCIKYAQYFARRQPMNFSQEDMDYYRRRMIWEILNNELIWP